MNALESVARQLRWVVSRLSTLMGFLAALCIVMITVSTLAEVFYRYFLGRSFLGVIELVEMLMAFIFFGLMSYTQLLKGHLRLTLFTDLLPQRAQLVLELATLLLVLTFVTVMAWQAWDEAIIATERQQIRFGAIEYPLWPGKLAAAAAVGAMALQLLSDFLNHLIVVIRGEGETGPMGQPASEADSV